MPVQRTHTVLISGAGIAGPALAYWLARYGFHPTVVERAPAPRPGVDERGFAYVDEHGRPLVRMPADLFGGEGIVAEIEILRGDLSAILYEATRHDTEYLFDDSVSELAQDDDGVKVRFERAAPRRFDLVVGADGVHSRVRGLAFGAAGAEAACVAPLGGYTAFYTVADRIDTGHWFLMHNAPGARVAGVRPDREGNVKAMFSFASPPLAYDRRDVQAQQRILVDRFAGVGWLVPRLLTAVGDAPDFYFDVLGQVHLDRWSAGRVVLLGDAGYSASPLAGLGTSLAIVGAYVLAGELAGADGDHRTAYARYEAELRGYVRQAQQLPPGALRGFLPATRTAIRLRNLAMRTSTRWPWRLLTARAFGKADAITLREYPVRRSPGANAR
jgi:2-polyprenyl-6-methoxyphenol hydroxylase-like FAD-dependent oxidoreductase